MLSERPDLDTDFSTKCDYLFANFLAYEKVQEYLINELYPASEHAVPGKALTWTGESVNLVKLAYVIYLTGQINNEQATIAEIIQWLEKQLYADVGNAYRGWHAISNTKRVTPTKFIDQMQEAINKRLDDENDLGKRSDLFLFCLPEKETKKESGVRCATPGPGGLLSVINIYPSI
ncbi:MAG TPA: RteC domain-containing protein [Puia sp.]|nr:RteC domain-containing protein [Puia sp.]